MLTTHHGDAYVIPRMPAKMRERIGELAKENMRSMNSEIVFRLAQALGFQGVTAAGSGPGKADPAAVSETTLPGVAPINAN